MNVTRRPRLLLMISCGWAVRSYLRSDFLTSIRKEMDVIVMLPSGDAQLEGELAAQGLEIAPLLTLQPPSWLSSLNGLLVSACNHRLGFWDRHLWNWMAVLQPRWKRPLWHVKEWVARVVAHTGAFNWLRKFEDRAFAKRAQAHAAAFEALAPDVVLSTNPYDLGELSGSLLARERGIPAIAAVVSWDNLSYKGPLLPDYSHFIVWGEAMKEDLKRHRPALKDEQVFIAGTPQFDFHLRADLMCTREEFFRRLGGDPKRKLITYSGVAVEWAFPREPEVVQHIWEAIRDGRIEGNPQLLVRSHPVDRSGRFQALEKTCPGILIQPPWPREIDEYWWFTPNLELIALLSNTLRHSDLNVNLASSMTLDSAILNTPVVNVAYTTVPDDPRAQRVPNGHRSFHYSRVMKCDAAALATNREELIAQINATLRNPDLHRAGRQKAVDWICGPVDGQASRRIADAVLRCAGVARVPAP